MFYCLTRTLLDHKVEYGVDSFTLEQWEPRASRLVQRAVLYPGTQMYYFALIHVLSVPWSLRIFGCSNKKCISALGLILRGAYIRNYTVV